MGINTNEMTNEQIESASWDYAIKQIDQPRGWIRAAFVAGAEWALKEKSKPELPRFVVGIDKLTMLVEMWAIDRGIDKAEPRAQFLKVVEEVGEIAAAMARDNRDELIDAIGDVFVTLVVLSMQHDIEIEDAIQAAYNEIKNRKGKTVNGVFLRDIRINESAK